uniref:Predicted protein n=1 Tax=Hordeum vulgare subsp. vulgare TaxID=112509 RepID=F2E3B7_HORVV|nr:predicted protein [Hordeum vulgare subsp. vulgare]
MAHEHCLFWSDDVGLKNGKWLRAGESMKKAAKRKCTACEETGASISCTSAKCRSVFHYGCARTLFADFDDQNLVLAVTCAKHSTDDNNNNNNNNNNNRLSQRDSAKDDQRDTTNNINNINNNNREVVSISVSDDDDENNDDSDADANYNSRNKNSSSSNGNNNDEDTGENSGDHTDLEVVFHNSTDENNNNNNNNNPRLADDTYSNIVMNNWSNVINNNNNNNPISSSVKKLTREEIIRRLPEHELTIIKLKEVEVGAGRDSLIAGGGFGKVLRGRWDNKEVALKVFKDNKDRAWQRWYQEVLIMKHRPP